MNIEIFTDGACSGNPGPGACACILRSGKHYKELTQAYRKTTNNRMELLAVIIGLEALRKTGNDVLVTSDSKYVVDAVEKGWLVSWLKNDFKGRKNRDLWIRYIQAASLQTVKFKWIKGHSLHEENERCDKLAVAACKSGLLTIDGNFETENP